MTSKMNFYAYLSYFILAIFISLILFFPSTVNAASLTPRSALDSYSNNNVFDTTGIADSDQRPQENFTYSSTLNTTYSRKLYGLRAYFNYSLTANHTYRLSIYTALSNFNWSAFNYSDLSICYGSSWSGANSNCSSSVGYSILSADTIAFNFRPTSNYTYFSFRIGPQNMVGYPLTSNFNYRITSFTLDDLSGPVTNPSNTDVINNDNQNTQIILDNVNSDTSTILNGQYQREQELLEHQRQMEQNIVNNQNNNTQDIIYNDNQNTNRLDRDLVNCQERTVKMEPRQSGAYIAAADGRINSNSAYMVSKFYRVDNRSPITINFKDIYGMGYGYLCNYNQNMQLMSCVRYMDMNSYSADPFSYSPSGTYISFTYKRNSGAQFTGNICNTSAETSNDIYNYISDSTDPNSSSIVDSLDNIGVGNAPISSLVTLPITLLDKFEDGISSTCTPFSLGNLLGTNLTLPCIDIPDLIGNNLWTIIDAITSIFMIYNIVMLIITAFDHLTSLSDDFDTLYTPDSIYESRLVKKRGYERHGD